MPVITIQVYRTTVVNGVVTASEPFTLTINDANGGNSAEGMPVLWDGTTGIPGNGHFYTANPIPANPIPATPAATAPVPAAPVPAAAPRNSTPKTSAAVLNMLNDIVHAPGYDIAVNDLGLCFLAGTMIATPKGDVPVETLHEGDLVLTRDHGPQPLVWTSFSHVSTEELDRAPNKRPIRIEAGAMGDGLPRRMVEVSPQHRVLLSHAGQEYLISARHLMMAGVPGVTVRREDTNFTLIHIAFDDHQIVQAEGAAMESFFASPVAMSALDLPQRLSLILAFPEIAEGGNPMTPARPLIMHQDYARMRAAARLAG